MRLFWILAIVLVSGFVLSVSDGAWPATELDMRILTELRWPRAVAAALVGSLLAVCGLFLQIVLRNPLAEPYILGLSGGASAAVMFGALLGLAANLTPLLALGGAALSLFLLMALTRMGRSDPIRLLLTGVLLSAGFGALSSLILTFSDPVRTQVSLVWLMGDLSGARLSSLWLVPWIAVVLLAARFSRLLDVFNRGPEAAAALGINLSAFRSLLLGVSGLLTALAVSIAGPIGFIGLLVPHAIRLSNPSGSHRQWVPQCAVAGAGLLCWADWLGRSLFDPIQIPAGVTMAVLGIPVLLLLLGRIYAAR